MRVGTVALSVMLAISTPPLAPQLPGQEVDLRAPDGAILKASYFNPGRPGPAVLLLHQCDRARASWVPLANALTARGVHVFTFDYRGFGASAESGGDWRAQARSRDKWPGDIDAAYAYLASRPGVDGTRIAAGGASCGVHNTIGLAHRSDALRAIFLMSGEPTLESAEVAYLRSHRNLPIFGAASSGDGNAIAAMRALLAYSRHPATTGRELRNAGHGVPMFTSDPTLMPALVDWLVARLQ